MQLMAIQDTGGKNRFRIPQSLDDTWEDVRPAKNYSDACPDSEQKANGVYGMSENCLSINIVRPAGLSDNARLPVMFWIHGEDFLQASTTSAAVPDTTSFLISRSSV